MNGKSPVNSRQQVIFRALVENYISEGEPISSGFLAQLYSARGLSSATIRNEFTALTQQGFLEQPYTSAGRVPTAKGYRFFVDTLLEEFALEDAKRQALKNMRDIIQLSAFLAQESHSLVLSCQDPQQVYEVGLSLLLEEPEFSDHEFLIDFIRHAEELRQKFTELIDEFEEETRLCIGEEGENIVGDRRLSFLFTPIKNQGFALFLSSTRMNYPKNLALAAFLSNNYE